MNSQQAKAALRLYRPNSADADDPRFAEALERIQCDPELAHWFEQQCALYEAIRAKLREIPVPGGVRERILAEQPDRRVNFVWWRQSAVLAAAAVMVVLIGLAGFWMRPREDTSLATYRNRMVRTVLREYRMDLATTNETEIRAFLASNQVPRDYVLPPGLDKMPRTGCGVLSWHGQRVAMVCFGMGKRTDMWLFIIQRSAVGDAPPPNLAQLQRVKKLMTASWIRADKLYVLAGRGNAESIRKFL